MVLSQRSCWKHGGCCTPPNTLCESKAILLLSWLIWQYRSLCAFRWTQSHRDCVIAQINHANSRIAASQHKLPIRVQCPSDFQQLPMMDQNRVASTAVILKQQQTNFSLNKESFREVLNQPQKPACKASEQASNTSPRGFC